jgi:hypothetical protein
VTAVARIGARLSFIDHEAFDKLVNSDMVLLLRLAHALAAEISRCRQSILGHSGIDADCAEIFIDESLSARAAAVHSVLGMFAAD